MDAFPRTLGRVLREFFFPPYFVLEGLEATLSRLEKYSLLLARRVTNRVGCIPMWDGGRCRRRRTQRNADTIITFERGAGNPRDRRKVFFLKRESRFSSFSGLHIEVNGWRVPCWRTFSSLAYSMGVSSRDMFVSPHAPSYHIPTRNYDRETPRPCFRLVSFDSAGSQLIRFFLF